MPKSVGAEFRNVFNSSYDENLFNVPDAVAWGRGDTGEVISTKFHMAPPRRLPRTNATNAYDASFLLSTFTARTGHLNLIVS